LFVGLFLVPLHTFWGVLQVVLADEWVVERVDNPPSRQSMTLPASHPISHGGQTRGLGIGWIGSIGVGWIGSIGSMKIDEL
jgi:hypothetical protein